jgi:hypothetical protein
MKQKDNLLFPLHSWLLGPIPIQAKEGELCVCWAMERHAKEKWWTICETSTTSPELTTYLTPKIRFF